jgi:hypothetical protein
MDSGRLQPALLGGAFIGVLSALPFINIGNCCCCMWVLAGGVLAVYLRQQNRPVVVDAAEGMLVGLMAGAIGGVVCTVLSIPIAMMMGPMQAEWMTRIMEGNNEMPPEVREMMERFAMGSGFALIGGLINVVVFSVFGLLGGLLGVAIFKKNTPPPSPPYTPPSAPYTPSAPPPPTVIPHDPGTAQ